MRVGGFPYVSQIESDGGVFPLMLNELRVRAEKVINTKSQL